jgi:hypothetical protein
MSIVISPSTASSHHTHSLPELSLSYASMGTPDHSMRKEYQLQDSEPHSSRRHKIGYVGPPWTLSAQAQMVTDRCTRVVGYYLQDAAHYGTTCHFATAAMGICLIQLRFCWCSAWSDRVAERQCQDHPPSVGSVGPHALPKLATARVQIRVTSDWANAAGFVYRQIRQFSTTPWTPRSGSLLLTSP